MIGRRAFVGATGAALAVPIVTQWAPSAPAIRRLLRSSPGDSVAVKDYVVGDGSADDTEAYRALMDLDVREYAYADDLTIALTSTVEWRGDRTHRFGTNARLVGDIDGYTVRGLGFPERLEASLVSPAGRGSTALEFDRAPELVPGDDFLLFDPATDEYDVNRVKDISGARIQTARPLNYEFASAERVLLYGLRNACRNVTAIGGEVRNVNAGLGAHGLGFLNATDIAVDGLAVTETGGIGLSFEVSMRWMARNVVATKTGASGLGGRVVRDFAVRDFKSRWPRRDESLTFYKNCTHGRVTSPDIAQFLYDEDPDGVSRAGNCILLDDRCCDIEIRKPKLRGSATYAILINNHSDRNRILEPDIANANLGGVRIANNSNDNYVAGGLIANVVNAVDPEQRLLATAAVQDDPTCTGNILGEGTEFRDIAGGVTIRHRGHRERSHGPQLEAGDGRL